MPVNCTQYLSNLVDIFYVITHFNIGKVCDDIEKV
jgi:hypothetical protein